MYAYLIIEHDHPEYHLVEYIIHRDGKLIGSGYGHRTRQAAIDEAESRIRSLKGV